MRGRRVKGLFSIALLAAGLAAAMAVRSNRGSVATLPPADVAAEMRARGNLLSPELVGERP